MTTNLHPALTHRIIINGGQWARGESEHDAREQFRRLHSSRPLKPADTQVWAVMPGTQIDEAGRFCRPHASGADREWAAPVLMNPMRHRALRDKHTAGPWHRVGMKVYAGSLFIADCDGLGGADRQGTSVANANLVAMAPKMLDALRTLLAGIDEVGRREGTVFAGFGIDDARTIVNEFGGKA